uniref:Galactose-3-O-sulfotransferase 2 n=1 Tax=Leptobrachium leishanense TaxID=445787 RepID=A0A8C5PE84_9ANUR
MHSLLQTLFILLFLFLLSPCRWHKQISHCIRKFNHIFQSEDVSEGHDISTEFPHINDLERFSTDLDDLSASTNAGTTRGSCQSKTHIFFLKTHKTASSTIMNILFRFGDARNLTFAFPFHKLSQFYYPAYFNSEYVDGFSKNKPKEFHIMCHHLRFQLDEVEKVMPNDTFYFTILRNPISLMESSYSYYKSMDIFRKSKTLEDFLNKTTMFYNRFSKNSNYAKNFMAFDLGFDHNGRVSAKKLKLMCQTVEVTFNLVLISEYFDESLILLKNALCWTIDDVLSIPLNSRSNETKRTISEESKNKIKNWNSLDWELYVYFNKSFWNQVEEFGRKQMEQEVEELRRRRAEISQVCLQGVVHPEKVQDRSLKPFQAGIAKILGYNLKPGLKEAEKVSCQKLVTPELQYSSLLWNKTHVNLQQKKHERTFPNKSHYLGTMKRVPKNKSNT